MRIGVAPHRLWPDDEDGLGDVLETARTAERLGFDHLIASSHVLAGDLGVTPDPVVMLSAIAGATSRIRLASSVLILPLYNPVVLAHQAATLDRLSGGRFTLGVGTGWDRDEFAAVGVPFGGRGKIADEQLRTVRDLWRGDAGGTRLGVRPLRSDGPPVWVGGQSEAALRRALRFGDAWHGAGVDAAELTVVRDRLARLAEAEAEAEAEGEREGVEAGRQLPLTAGAFLVPPGFPSPLDRLPGHPLGGPEPTTESVLDDLGRLGDAGLVSCSLWLPVRTEAMQDALGWVAEEILPFSLVTRSSNSPLPKSS